MENKDYIIIYNPELQQQYLDSQIQIYKDMLKLVIICAIRKRHINKTNLVLTNASFQQTKY